MGAQPTQRLAESDLPKDAPDLLLVLAKARTAEQAREVVEQLERAHGYKWRPVGDRENNYGTINIGSDPGHAFIERVTNAIDAVIEREASSMTRKGKGRALPATPREAVETWFDVPSGRVSRLEDIRARPALAAIVVVTLLESPNNRSGLSI